MLFNFSFILINNLLNDCLNRFISIHNIMFEWKTLQTVWLWNIFFTNLKYWFFWKVWKKTKSLKVFIKHNHISHEIFYNKSFFTRKLNIKTHIKKKEEKNHKLFFLLFSFSIKKKKWKILTTKYFFNMNLKLKLLGNRKISFHQNFISRTNLFSK